MKFIQAEILVAIALCAAGVGMERWISQSSALAMLNADGNQKAPCQPNDASCSLQGASTKDQAAYVLLAKTATTTSKVRVLTGRYESNLLKIISWLPKRWDLVAVLKWSAYGNDINILGPVAAKVAPALGVLSNKDVAALAPYNPKAILRIGPTNYKLAKDAVVKGLNVQEFIGSVVELNAVTRVAKEHKTVIGASIYLFDHYGDPWGFEFNTPAELQHLVDSVDSHFVKVRGIFTHLGYLSDGPVAPITKRVQKFLRIACPVAVKIAATLAPEDPPVMVHWGASSELSRLRNPRSGKLELTPDLLDLADVCMSHPKVKLGIRVGSATYGSADDLPDLQPVLWWTYAIMELGRTATATVAVVKSLLERFSASPKYIVRT